MQTYNREAYIISKGKKIDRNNISKKISTMLRP